MNSNPPDDLSVDPLAETENYMAFSSSDDDGEKVYHVELFNITLHFYEEEWREFLALIHAIPLED